MPQSKSNSAFTSSTLDSADVILVGAGLANGILACFLRNRYPQLRILLLEAASEIPTSRTWCFHHSDLNQTQHTVIQPLIAKQWFGYDVQFPDLLKKSFDSRYYAINPQQLQNHLQSILQENLKFNQNVTSVSPHSVQLSSGETLTAACVVDGRGCRDSFAPCGYQKFVGLHVRLKAPHGLERPILMDATVPQLDGYRFMYVLPWSENELLIEDTRYSENARLEVDAYEHLILHYAASQQWKVQSVSSQESGVLPLPLNFHHSVPKNSSVPTVGMAAGLFHPVTGYSLPDAVRIADLFTKVNSLHSEKFAQILQEYKEQQKGDWKYLCLLNRMMFQAAKPTERYKIFERFYTLDKNLIQRFYRGKLFLRDKVRILMGKPPVPVFAAMKSLRRPLT